MKNDIRKKLILTIALFGAFALWTLSVCVVDVQPIGPHGSTVGFASANRLFHNLTGVHMSLYVITDWLGLVPVAFSFGFAVLGLVQWIQRKCVWRVDRSILVLGGFYILVLVAYILFEEHVVNYRPVLIEGYLEASYPSSTTLLVMCVMPTTMMQLHARMKECPLQKFVLVLIILFMAFMVVGRLLSGVHWLSDIIGGALLSAGLVTLYSLFA